LFVTSINMQKIIIFDFNRTIYDPDRGALLPNVELVLQTLQTMGFALFLVSRAGESRRKLIADLGIAKYFVDIVVSDEKSRKDFASLLSPEVSLPQSFVVGDRVRQEIAIGNSLGFQTIWLRQGRFSQETPQNDQEEPKFIIQNLSDLPGLLSG